jgi:hypothetical protein
MALLRAHGLSRIVVATSNLDLPALYVYQRWRFAISDVRPGASLQHHGGQEAGLVRISVRDELRLARCLLKR